ncbi:heterokaryon incompatibility protein-domain-containing protein [Fusarium oxysporum II5]|nr:heterokaryon incompatibility protein-domain-containing protein [Fusarium oxysporum II5]
MSLNVISDRRSRSPLCKTCFIFFTVPHNLSTQQPPLSHISKLVTSFQFTKCAFCTHVVQQMKDARIRSEFPLTFNIHKRHWNLPKPVWRVSTTLANNIYGKSLLLFHGNKTNKFPRQEVASNEFGISCSTESATSRNLVQKWHRDCLEKHQACESSKAWVPTRLVKIYDTHFRVIRHVDHDSEPYSYVALSHCWGRASILKLTAATKNDLFQGTPISRLPKTFRDAITVCRWLGYPCIWIDSLCITQDSNEDWTTEAHMMTDVYGNSALTIVAAHARDGTEGLFCNRPPLGTKAPIIDCSWGPNSKPEPYCLVDHRLWISSVENSHLSSRAWAVQERFLSTKRLYFTEHQVFYRCATHEVCESFSAGETPSQLIENTALQSVERNLEPREKWVRAAEVYSRACLTKDTDKIVAIAGIAENLRAALGGRSRPDPCLAPTWSWIAVKGVGVNINSTICSSGCHHHINIIHASVDLVDPSRPTGDIHQGSGIVQIRGSLKQVYWSPRKYSDGDWRKYQITFEDEQKGALTTTHPDYLEDSLTDRRIFLLPVLSTEEGQSIECLVLTPVIEQARIYERTGTCSDREKRGMISFRGGGAGLVIAIGKESQKLICA